MSPTFQQAGPSDEELLRAMLEGDEAGRSHPAPACRESAEGFVWPAQRGERALEADLGQDPGDDGEAGGAGLAGEAVEELNFESLRVEVNAATADLLIRRALEAEIADAEALRAALDRRPEGAAGDGAPDVEVAGPGSWVEGRTRDGLKDGEEPLLSLFILGEHSGVRVAWEGIPHLTPGGAGAGEDAAGAAGIAAMKLCNAPAQAQSVELSDLKGAQATGVATGAAGHPGAGPGVGRGKGGVYGADQHSVRGRDGSLRVHIPSLA